MLLNGDSASSNQAPHPPSASVKLRRRNRQQSSSTPDAGKKKGTCISLLHLVFKFSSNVGQKSGQENLKKIAYHREMPLKNRHSGDFFHWSPSRQLQEERRALRKSGDWSYVGFLDGPRNTVSVVGSQVHNDSFIIES